MRRAARTLAAPAAALALLASGCGGPDGASEAGSPLALRLESVASGLSAPVQAVATGADPDGLYLVEQTGLVRILEGGELRARPFLDLRGEVKAGGEQGLLSLAFHPEYAENRRFFVMYTDRQGDTRVAEYRARPAAAPARVRRLLFVDQPYENHNGGTLAFGPDGKLWLGLGDGGSAYDPQSRSQNLAEPFGKLLRVDVDAPRVRWDTVALGLRNPWRMSFDRETGDLWIGDVGQDRWEEVDVVPREPGGLLDFGWDVYEGFERIDEKPLRTAGRLVEPAAVYGRDEGCSITGGFVYRGKSIPALRGRYVYGDYCNGTIWSLELDGGKGTDVRREAVELPNLTSFGEGADGELYLVQQDGNVFALVPDA